MAESTDQVTILYQDLELFTLALQNAENQTAAFDALLGIRNLKMERSKLRNQLHRAVMRAHALLASIDDEPEE